MQIEKLTEAEEVTMKAIWDCKKEPVLSDVVERVHGIYGRDWRPQTVSTFLAKLVRKQYIKMQRDGKNYTYKILVSEGMYRHKQLEHLYMYLYKNDKEGLQRDVETI